MNEPIYAAVAIVILGIVATVWSRIQQERQAKIRKEGREIAALMGFSPKPHKSKEQRDKEQAAFLRDVSSGKVRVIDGGSGTSAEDSVIVNAPNSMLGIDAEYQWLKIHYGISNSTVEAASGWRIVDRRIETGDFLLSDSSRPLTGRTFECFELKHKNGSSKQVWFDITSFFGGSL